MIIGTLITLETLSGSWTGFTQFTLFDEESS